MAAERSEAARRREVDEGEVVPIAIRSATSDDGAALRAIERAAGERFREVGMPEVADDEPPSIEVLASDATDGRSWVAVDADGAIAGYALVDVVDGAAHVEQVSVHPDHQGQGVGRALLDHVTGWAAERGLPAVTLTTFAAVPWNAPLYRHLGFVDLVDGEIGPGLRRRIADEAAHGLDPAHRTAMRRVVDPEPAVVRRAPFSENPQVGVRGQRAQQRILEAALQAFGELGYHPCGIGQIAEAAGCSRASVYQYFASKEDVFRHLAGQVARQLTEAVQALEPITADAAGWDAIRGYLERHAVVHRRFEPVFDAFAAAAESDEAVAGGSARIEERLVATVRSKLVEPTLAAEHLDLVIGLLLNVVTRAPRVSEVLRIAVPSTSMSTERVRSATADVIHRSLFGLDPAVNVQPPARRRPVPPARLDAALRAALADGPRRDLTPAGVRTRDALLDSAHEVLVGRGYHGTRVDDVTEAAGVSHGAFYRYFANKDELVRALAMRAMGRFGSAFAELPDARRNGRSLRTWLARYGSSYAHDAVLVRVWIEATASDPLLRLESATAMDWGRRRMARFLEGRGFGDVETDALLAVALLDAMGARPQSAALVEAAALVVERGLLGRDR